MKSITALNVALNEIGQGLREMPYLIAIDKFNFSEMLKNANKSPPGYPLKRAKNGRMMKKGK